MVEPRGFRVVIAGGGIAGLTLANALERGGVDFVLLERRDEIAPQIGASIAMLPNGCRILDQLGIYDDLHQQTEPIIWEADRDSKGRLLAPRSDFARLGGTRSGYDIAFGDRQLLLKLLFDRIQDKTKVLVNKKIVDVVHSPDGVAVKCEDGTTYEGDILAGADGVASKTREALLRLAGGRDPKLVEKDKDAMTAEYQCLFGICSPIQGLDVGDLDYGYGRNQSSLVAVSKAGRTYYFIFQRLDKVCRGADIPHYSRREVEEFAKAHADMRIRPNIPFAALWKNTISSSLVALEEATFDTWTWGRIACLGDSIHKMTPNVGAGGNAAIESAAALASAIKEMVDKTPGSRPAESQIKEYLASYQRTRQKRASIIVWISAQITRLQALRGFYHRIFAGYCIPYLGDFLQDTLSNMTVGATAISYLPLPRRSVQGTMPFNPTQGDGQKESIFKRAALGLPFLVLFYVAKKLMDPAPLIPLATEIIKNGRLPWGDVSIATSFYHLEWLDDLLAPLAVFFSPVLYGFDAVTPQAFLFLVDYGVVLAVWLIESVRRANALTLSQLPIYYFLHYIAGSIENFKATDMRLTRISYTKAILPAVVLVYYVPLYASFGWPDFPGRISWNFFWQLYPVWLSLLASQVLSRFFSDTTMHDRIHDAKRDLPAIRVTVGVLACHAAAVWLYAWTAAGFSPRAILALVLPPFHSPQNTTDLIAFAGEFLRFDSAFLFANTFLWLGYLFWDIKHAGMLSLAWVWIVLLAVVAAAALGPGAAAGLGWLWREELLASRRHWAAVTEQVARERNRRVGVEWEDEEDGGKSLKERKDE